MLLESGVIQNMIDPEGKIRQVQLVLLFRDILRGDANVRQAYETLKLKLSEAYVLDRELYTNSKLSFIEATLKQAKFI